MPNALYQKYRPKRFCDLFGQVHVKVAIENQIATEKIAHAYLFCGPRAVGKTTIARLVAKSLNCEKRKKGESEPCNECPSCLEINQGNAIDMIEIDAASHTGVDNVRENIIASARITPVRRKYKVFIIDEVHMLSTSAFNALLKTLEEPPANVIFILATTEIHKVPATIISRCQRFDFKKISNKDMMEKLQYIVTQEGKDVDKEVLFNIAMQSEGCLRDAESLLGQVLFLDDKKITMEKAELVIPKSDFSLLADFSELLFSSKLEEALYFINKLQREGVDLKQFLKDFVPFLRKIMLAKIGNGLDYFGLDFDEKTEKIILQIAVANEVGKMIKAIEFFMEASEGIKRSDIPSLPIELAILKFLVPEEKKEFNAQFNFDMGRKTIARPPVSHESASLPKVSQASERKEAEEKTEVNEIKTTETETATEEKKKTATATGEGVEKAAENIEVADAEATEKKFKEALVKISVIERRWQEILDNLGKTNHSLCFVLKVSKPLKISGNTLTLAHSHEFHASRVQDMKNKRALEHVLQEMFSCDLIVESIVDNGLKAEQEAKSQSGNAPGGMDTIIDLDNDKAGSSPAPRQEDNLLADVLEEFGGEVVE